MLQRQFQNGEYSSEHSSLSRPYRTYPQHQKSDWTLHHHKIDMDKVMETAPGVKPEFSGSATSERATPPNTVNLPNGGHMIKVGSFDDQDGQKKLML